LQTLDVSVAEKNEPVGDIAVEAQPNQRSSSRDSTPEKYRTSSISEAAPSAQVLLLCYGRLKDAQLLASRIADEAKGTEKDLMQDSKNLLQLAKKKNYKPGSKDKLDNKKRECKVMYVIDDKGEFMAIAMVQSKYPEAVAFSRLLELNTLSKKHADEARSCGAGGLNLMLKGALEQLSGPATQGGPYSRRGSAGGAGAASPASRASVYASNVLDKMDAIKDSIRSTVAVAQENTAQLHSLQSSTRRMDNAAHAFGEHSRLAVWKHTLARYRMWAYIGILLIDFASISYVWSA
jgi:hypothetical protein